MMNDAKENRNYSVTKNEKNLCTLCLLATSLGASAIVGLRDAIKYRHCISSAPNKRRFKYNLFEL